MDEKKEAFGGIDPRAVGTQVLDFMKSSFDAGFDNVVKLQAMNEKMIKDLVEKNRELQVSAVKVIDDFSENARKGRDQYKKIMEDGFKKVKELIGNEK